MMNNKNRFLRASVYTFIFALTVAVGAPIQAMLVEASKAKNQLVARGAEFALSKQGVMAASVAAPVSLMIAAYKNKNKAPRGYLFGGMAAPLVGAGLALNELRTNGSFKKAYAFLAGGLTVGAGCMAYGVRKSNRVLAAQVVQASEDKEDDDQNSKKVAVSDDDDQNAQEAAVIAEYESREGFKTLLHGEKAQKMLKHLSESTRHRVEDYKDWLLNEFVKLDVQTRSVYHNFLDTMPDALKSCKSVQDVDSWLDKARKIDQGKVPCIMGIFVQLAVWRKESISMNEGGSTPEQSAQIKKDAEDIVASWKVGRKGEESVPLLECLGLNSQEQEGLKKLLIYQLRGASSEIRSASSAFVANGVSMIDGETDQEIDDRLTVSLGSSDQIPSSVCTLLTHYAKWQKGKLRDSQSKEFAKDTLAWKKLRAEAMSAQGETGHDRIRMVANPSECYNIYKEVMLDQQEIGAELVALDKEQFEEVVKKCGAICATDDCEVAIQQLINAKKSYPQCAHLWDRYVTMFECYAQPGKMEEANKYFSDNACGILLAQFAPTQVLAVYDALDGKEASQKIRIMEQLNRASVVLEKYIPGSDASIQIIRNSIDDVCEVCSKILEADTATLAVIVRHLHAIKPKERVLPV